MTSNKFSVMQEISRTEEVINSTYDRIHVMEQKLRSDSIPDSKKSIIKQELTEVRKLLKTHEHQLAHLRTHNRKTFLISAALVFIVFVFYMLYVLLWNENSQPAQEQL